MQNPSRHNYNVYAPLQPVEPLPNWSWSNRVVGSNKGPMEIGGLLSGNAGQTANAEAQLRHQMQQSLTMSTHFNMGHAPGGMSNHSHQYNMVHPANTSYPHVHQVQHPHMMHTNISPVSAHSPSTMTSTSSRVKNEPAIKNFKCSTCPKAFARRSDLARHERIHSGHKPHKCDFPNCGKDFIQRSALTVHQRVHTGEKPHSCEICAKPFSDSSSLARHRRIHSGKRPYQCPFATCKKTFTRRTTLTRHQAQHVGSVEQAAVEVNDRLSILSTGQSLNSSYSDSRSSRNSTVSPLEASSISPTIEQPHLRLHRQSQDLSYVPQNQSVPQHMRNDYAIPHDSTISSALSSFYDHGLQPRASVTSNPSKYSLPQPLEPPTNGTGSGGTSPHISAMSWGPPSHGTLPSPSTMDFGNYPNPMYAQQQIYFPTNSMRRPQSTEPEDWSLRPSRILNNNFNHMHMGHDWTAMTVSEVKQERTFAI